MSMLVDQYGLPMLSMSAGDTSAYHGASVTRPAMRHAMPSTRSANAEVIPALKRLRPIARDLYRNNALAGGAVRNTVTHVVGTGLAVQPAVAAAPLNITQAQASALSAQAKTLFGVWAGRPASVDVRGKLDFYWTQDLWLRSELCSGDVIAALVYDKRPGDVFGTKVQIFEADRVCNPDNKAQLDADAVGEWVDGFMHDEYGRAVKVAIANRHPEGGKKLTWTIRDIYNERGQRQVMHGMTEDRPGQARGVPYLTPVIELLMQLGRYTEAEIAAAVISAAFTVFVEHEGAADNPAALDAAMAGQGAGPMPELQLASGMVVDLARGEKVSFANPARPNAAFDPFVVAILRQIGVALELPFELLVKHFQSSYSAARGALLEAWRFFMRRRSLLAMQYCQPVYEAIFTECVITGRLRAPGFLRDPYVRELYLRASWVGDAPGTLDPLKEAQASTERLNNRTSNLAKECMGYDGADWADVHAQREIEIAAGAMVQQPAQQPAAQPAAPAKADDTEADDTAKQEDA